MISFGANVYAQNIAIPADTARLKYPFLDSRTLELRPKSGIFLPNPSNIRRSVEFDPLTRSYIIREKIGERFYREPLYLSIDEYQRYESSIVKRNYWRQLADKPVVQARDPGFIPEVTIKSK